MKAEVKTLWLTELRYGERKQGTGQLRRDGRYCCLGVLCDLAARAGIGKWLPGRAGEGDSFVAVGAPEDWSMGELPIAVQDWAGLECGDPMATDRQRDVPVNSSLATLNDDEEMTFAEIADVIEREL